MTNKKFKEIKTNMYSFTKNYNFVSDKLISVTINGVEYGRLKREGNLTARQLEEFEFLNDFEIEEGISL